MLKNKRGVSVLTIGIAVVIMLIIVTTIEFTAINNLSIQKLDNLYNDIRLLKEKVDLYYLRYGKLPLSDKYTEISAIPAEILNPNDGADYYKINLNALNNITLNTTIDNESFFIINKDTHTIYYPKGVEHKGVVYYKLPETYGNSLSIRLIDIETNANLSGRIEVYSDKECLNLLFSEELANKYDKICTLEEGTYYIKVLEQQQGYKDVTNVIEKKIVANQNNNWIIILSPLDEIRVNYWIDSETVYSEGKEKGDDALSYSTFTPALDGYKFVGWREDTQPLAGTLSEMKVDSEDIDLYAVFKKDVILSYNGNGESSGSVESQTGTLYYNNGNKISPSFTIAEIPYTKRYNYSQEVWAQGSVDGNMISPGTTVTISDDTTFYALWKLYPDDIIYDTGTVNYSYNLRYQMPGSTNSENYIRFNSTNIALGAYEAKMVQFTTKFSHQKYRYVKATIKGTVNKVSTENSNVSAYLQTRSSLLTNSEFQGNSRVGLYRLLTYAIMSDEKTQNITSYTTYTIDMDSITEDFYVNVMNSNTNVNISKIWLTNTN